MKGKVPFLSILHKSAWEGSICVHSWDCGCTHICIGEKFHLWDEEKIPFAWAYLLQEDK